MRNYYCCQENYFRFHNIIYFVTRLRVTFDNEQFYFQYYWQDDNFVEPENPLHSLDEIRYVDE